MPRALILLLVSFALVACGGRQVPPPDDEVTDPALLVEAIDARLDGAESLRARTAIEYFGEEGRVRVQQAMVARVPGDLRIETLTPFDTTLNLLVANANELIFLDMESSTMYVGQPSADAVAQLFPMALSPADIVRVMLGGAPLDAVVDDPTGYSVSWQSRRRQGYYRLALPLRAGGELVLSVEHGTWAILGAEAFDASGDRIYELTTSQTRLEGGVPAAIRFVLDADGTDITLDVESVTLNPMLPDLLFELEPAPGVSVQPL